MRSLFTLATALFAYSTTIYATALTYRLEAHEKACFFAQVDNKGTKVAFYFAVQSGGSFDIDYSVVGPSSHVAGSTDTQASERVILDGTKERQGDFVFTANEVGEYRFCFNNEMSTFAEKMVDFEIAVCDTFFFNYLSIYYYSFIRQLILSTCTNHLSSSSMDTGRKRSPPRRHPLEARLLARADVGAGGVDPQALGPAVDHLAQPKVLSHAREPQLQHRQEHREAHLQLFPHGEWPHGHHGGAAGVYCPVLLPGREKRYIMIPFLMACLCW